MARKFMSLVFVIAMIMGVFQTMAPTAEAADDSALEISFSNMNTYWDNTWGDYEFIFEFTCMSSENIYEVGVEVRESDGFLKYRREIGSSCTAFDSTVLQLNVDSDLVKEFVPGETYNWKAFAIYDGQQYDSQVEYFTFPEKPETDNIPTISILSQPTDKKLEQGEKNMIIKVFAISSNGNLSYQWYSNETRSNTGGTEIDGATSSYYTLPTDETGTMYYYCLVTNTGENEVVSVVSEAAQVKVESSEPIEPEILEETVETDTDYTEEDSSIEIPDVELYDTDTDEEDIDEIMEYEIMENEIPQFSFTDVKSSDWFYNDVKKAYESGLIDGTSLTTFSPNNYLTYAEAVKLAACMHQKYTTGSVTMPKSDPWYQSYVDYAKANGIIHKDYAWDSAATRAGYMGIFANVLPASALSALNSVEDGAIPDVPMTEPYAAAIYKLYRAGIVMGVDTEHNCNPASNIKRCEVAVILTHMMDSSKRVRFNLP